MSRSKVLLISFAPKHSSSLNRIADCTDGRFDLEVYDSATDKVKETISNRVFSTKFPKLILALLRSDANVLWAWGLDACFLVTFAALLKPRVLLIWDISDLNPRVLAHGWKARVLRTIERRLLKRVDLLLLTSEAFFNNYYCGHIDRNRVKVVENFLPGIPPKTLPHAPPLTPCTIVYSGIFRSMTVLSVLKNVANIMQGEVEFHLHGYPDRTIPITTFEQLISESPWVHFHGRFKPEELEGIYTKAHLNWAFVDPDANDNERWLLTNRIYNAAAFGRPALANAGIYLGEVVCERRIGVTCHLVPDEIAATIRSLMANGGARYTALVKNMPPPQSVYLAGHYRDIIECLLSDARS